MNKKELAIYIVVIVILIGILVLSNYLFNGKKENNTETKTVYGLVKSTNDDYVVLEDVDTKKKVVINKDMEVKDGDIVVIKYEEKIDDCKYEIIGNSNELTEPTTKEVTTTTTTISTSTTSKVTNSTKNNTTKKTTTTTITVKKKESESDVLRSIQEETDEAIENTNDDSKKGKVKDTFIKLVDFIFYDGEIKGYKFHELTDKGKAKVIYYALKLDGKIDEKWPDYKEKISDKTIDIKAKLIAKYMEYTTNICSKYPDQCAEVKEDWNYLKEKFKYTWTVIKDAFVKYAKPKGVEAINKIKEWYEVFSGKSE